MPQEGAASTGRGPDQCRNSKREDEEASYLPERSDLSASVVVRGRPSRRF
jgi:hypothetical protein